MNFRELTCQQGTRPLSLHHNPNDDTLSLDTPGLLSLSRAEVIRLRDALTEFLTQPPAWGDAGAVSLCGLDFTRVPRGGPMSAGLWDEPWLVLWPAHGYSNRTGLFRLSPGMKEQPMPATERGSKKGYALARLAYGVYVARTAHADQMTQHAHYLHYTAEGLTLVTDINAQMLLVNYGG